YSIPLFMSRTYQSTLFISPPLSHPTSPSFPYPTPFRSRFCNHIEAFTTHFFKSTFHHTRSRNADIDNNICFTNTVEGTRHERIIDRKSTHLNSSHVSISYAVFCLKKKKKEQRRHDTTTT